ncbi:glucosamine-6-phosphatedeaminase [Haloferula helveola]|uniref:Glucosamine-6-phosphate deaminase n=1 Tax=Haloferula helveola TaxID=490095 RepID=A0ABN6GYX1_9BACT|nr:glucosamine-6-phosphatedeaminase [Haloferula helveola]
MTRSPNVTIFADKAAACRSLAAELAKLIRETNATGRSVVLGLATGSTPIPLYQELIRLHSEEGLSFSQVITFNLDEYLGLERQHPESYWTFMHRQLFDHVDIPAENIHIPSGTVGDVAAHCAEYEAAIEAAGGIDFQLLGIGRTGHIGFNEPGSPRDSRTRRIELDPVTREDAAPAFGGLDKVPTHAITMGCGTILAARRIGLLAFGAHKAAIVREAIEGPVTDQVSASFLQDHPDACFYLDRAAAGQL